MKEIRPNFVINAAAYTDVDGCESNADLAYAINGDAVKILAKACNLTDSVLVHISTDYVFDGRKDGYGEEDTPNPINIYGKSKHLGERYLTETAKKYYLIRTAWLYGKHGKNFVDTILKLAKSRKELEVVNDQRGSPTYTKDLSAAIRHLIDATPAYGIYHLTNDGMCTWFEFACKIIGLKGLPTNMKAISSDTLKRAARRPACSVLLNTKLPKLRRWESALSDYLSEAE